METEPEVMSLLPSHPLDGSSLLGSSSSWITPRAPTVAVAVGVAVAHDNWVVVLYWKSCGGRQR
jgi:hypothetical protein